MNAKKFHAESLHEGLKLVKKEFGPDAVILSTRHLKPPKSMLGIFGKPTVEITAASDYTALADASTSTGSMRPQASPSGGVLDSAQIEKFVDPLQTELRNLRRMLQKHLVMAPEADASWRPNPFAQEIQELKKMLRALLEKNQADPLASLPAKIRLCYEEMVANGVDRQLSIELANKVASRHPRPRSYGDVKLLMAHEVMTFVKTAEENGAINGKRKVIALIGPTGSGKTTTLAKIAANSAIKGGRKTAIFTIDNHRIAAAEQLKVYAKIMGLPFELTPSAELLQKAFLRHSEEELILIDTPGIAPREKENISHLGSILSGVADLETHLVLSATAKDSDLEGTAGSFAQIPHEKLIFTKLDETTSHGVILNQLVRTSKCASFFAAGQKVPEDLEVATKERIADLVLKISEHVNFVKGQAYGPGIDLKGNG